MNTLLVVRLYTQRSSTINAGRMCPTCAFTRTMALLIGRVPFSGAWRLVCASAETTSPIAWHCFDPPQMEYGSQLMMDQGTLDAIVSIIPE